MNTSLESIRQQEQVFGVTKGDVVAFFHAHADDEMATGAATLAVQAAGAHVIGVTATNGEASDRGGKDFLNSGGRLAEAKMAWLRYGVPQESQIFLGLPDGGLNRTDTRQMLAESFAWLISRQGITHIITPGEGGFDGHADHIAVHEAALTASGIVKARNQAVPDIWGLAEQDVDETIQVVSDDKLWPLAANQSQFHIESAYTPDVREGWVRLGNFDIEAPSFHLLQPYMPLLTQQESYRLFTP